MSLNPTMWNVPLTALDVWNTARITELNLSTSLSSPLSLCSITAVRRMILRWTWALWRERTLSHTSPATPATPSPWTARPSTPSLWTSWKRARTTTTARPARRTPSAPDTQTTCVTEASVWASTPTTRTRPSPSRCPPTRRAPPLWVSTAPRTCFLPRRAPTAPWSDLCCTRNTHTHTGKTENTHHTYTQHMTFLFETTFRWWIRIQHSNTHTHQHYRTCSLLPQVPDSFIQRGGDPKTEPPCGQRILGPGPRGAADISNKWCFISRDMVQNSSASQTTRGTKMCLCWSDLSCDPVDIHVDAKWFGPESRVSFLVWVPQRKIFNYSRNTWLIHDKSIVDLTLVILYFTVTLRL